MQIQFLWCRRGQLSHRFFKYQFVLTKFQNLKIIYTEGNNLAFPNLLSRHVPIKETKKFQIEHKTITENISFYTSGLKPVSYCVLHKKDKTNSSKDSYPILAQIKGGTRYTKTIIRYIYRIIILVYLTHSKDLQTLVMLYIMYPTISILSKI